MEYLSSLELAVENSSLYRDFLSRMPVPFNNIYFDTVLTAVLFFYLMYRIVDGIRMQGRRIKLRRMQQEAVQRNEEERMLRAREAELQRGKMNLFMQFLQTQRGQQCEEPAAYRADIKKRVGTSRFRIGSTHSATDFERLMEEARRNEEG